MVKRFEMNPIINPEDIKPIKEGWKVIGAYNPGAFYWNGKIALLVRVIEKPVEMDQNIISVPMLENRGGVWSLTAKTFNKNDPDVDWQRDPRFLYYKNQTYDVIYSDLRLALSDDGKKFTVAEKPTFLGAEPLTVYGVHDPRVIYLEDEYHILYTGNSEWGTPAFRSTTKNFVDFTQHGVIFPPDNKDNCLFPEKIHGQYLSIHRPAAAYFEGYNMWLAQSSDLVYWGSHKPLIKIREGSWDSRRIGCGAEPIRTHEGWIVLYHGSDGQDYHMGALLLDADNPEKVKGRSKAPFLSPEEWYEKEGFFNNVVFSNGHVMIDDETIYVYYGAADKYTAGCELTLGDIFDTLG